MEEKRLKNDPLVDVGEKEGAEIELDNNEQTKVVAEEKKEEVLTEEGAVQTVESSDVMAAYTAAIKKTHKRALNN